MARNWVIGIALLAVWTSWALGAPQPAVIGEDLIVNGDMEADGDGDGLPDEWRFTPHRNQGEMTTAPGRDGGKCLKMTCPVAPPDTNGVLVAQYGTCAVERGKAYRVTFWARAEGFGGDVARVALRDTDGWHECGLTKTFVPTGDWGEHSYDFVAERTCSETSRLQFWFVHTGSLLLDDVSFVEVEAPKPSVEHMLPPKAEGNLIPNSSFELEAAGWGSWAPGGGGWRGRAPSRLLGQSDDAAAVDGRNSLRLALDRDNLPVFYFDWFPYYRIPLTTLCAGHIGWAQLQKGQDYVFSAYLKAEPAGTVGVLHVQQRWGGGLLSKTFELTSEWQRYEFPFRAQGVLAIGMAGLDLEASQAEAATIWIDAVQLEQGSEATRYQPRDAFEAVLTTQWPGNIIPTRANSGKGPFRLDVVGYGVEKARGPWQGTLTVRGFADDKEALSWEFHFDPGVQWPVMYQAVFASLPKGYYRAQLLLEGEEEPLPYRDLRCAIINPYVSPYDADKYDGDSRFGINHAYPWPELVDLGKMAGLTWARDWSLKWDTVEPQPGQVDFAEPDYQINRVLERGMKVLAMFPFPSSNWSSEAPDDVQPDNTYPSIRRRMAFMPRDLGLARQFMERTVRHYKGRITHWQILNEPYYTSYSLPRAEGYGPEDYARFLKVAYAACKAGDPDSVVLGGYGAPPRSLSLYESLVAEGGLDSLDLMDIHIYPGSAPPEAFEASLQRLVQMAGGPGKAPPLWLTEHGYYADDDPPQTPLRHWSEVLDSEEQCGVYMVRFATIMFANGVEKIFYHSGTHPTLISSGLECQFFEYGNVPRKQYAVQAGLANWFTPKTRFVAKIDRAPPFWGYLFEGDRGPFAVVWTVGTERTLDRRLLGRCRPFDLFGNGLWEGQLTLSGTPLFLRGANAEALTAVCERLVPANG
ncbi:MAG: endo-1,4-beta-xylanase [Armatimonadota bacterium]